MASLNSIAQINISTQSVQVKQAGFGVPLIVDASPSWVERVRTYTDLAGMVSDGFATTSAAYKAAAKLLSQNPQISKFKIGRRANKPTLQVTLTPTVANSTAYKVKLNGTEVTFTSDASATLAEITAGLAAALTALGVSGVTVADTTTTVTLTGSAAGNWFYVEPVDISLIKAMQTHADPGIAADMDAILLADSDWYGWTLTTGSEAELTAAAAWTEAQKKIACHSTQDTECATVVYASATDVGHDLEVANYNRTSLWFSPKPDDFVGAAVLGKAFPNDPGSLTFKFKQLAGVTAYPLTATHITNLEAKSVNYFADFGGLGMTAQGVMCSGEYIDIIRDRDWFESRLQVRIVTVLANLNKLPFTDKGIAVVEAEIRAQLQEGIAAGFLSGDTPPTITVPKASEVSAADKAARKLTGISFQATVAGAVHMVTISGTVSV